MFFVLSKILDIFLSPLTWALLLLAYGAPLTRRAVRNKRARPVACVLGLATLLVFSAEPVSNALFGHLESLAVRTMSTTAHYDAVVLLGGLVDDRAMTTSRSLSLNDNVERMLGSLEVLKSGRADYVIVSGGSVEVDAEFVEARVLRDELVSLGVPSERVIVEDQAKNTRENATYTAEIARARGFHKLLIVTSAFHMRRAAACYAKVGLEFDTLPVDYRSYGPELYSGSWMPRAVNLERSAAGIREWFGYYIYRARGYVD